MRFSPFNPMLRSPLHAYHVMFRVSTHTSTSLQKERITRSTYLAEHFHPRISALVAAADVQELQPQVIRHGAEGGISDQEALLQDELL
jgi:hypothetical protein